MYRMGLIQDLWLNLLELAKSTSDYHLVLQSKSQQPALSSTFTAYDCDALALSRVKWWYAEQMKGIILLDASYAGNVELNHFIGLRSSKGDDK